MAQFRVTLLRVETDSNPEEHVSIIEAKDTTTAQKIASGMLTNPRGLGWRSWGDPSLWGKVQKKVVKIEPVQG